MITVPPALEPPVTLGYTGALRRDGRVVEGAPLLREYTGKTCIVGSNPTLSAR